MPKSFTRRLTVAAASAMIMVALGACQGPPVALPPAATELADSAWPTTQDTFDPERVTAAAHGLISRYLATTDAITQEGGGASGRMANLTTASWFPTEEAAFAHYREQGLRTIGDTEFDSLVVQSVSESVTGAIHIDAIVCVDASWVWLVPTDAPDPPEGLMEWLRFGEDDMEISDDDYWLWSEYVDEVGPLPGEREAIVVWLVGKDLSSLAIDGTVNWEGANACHTTGID